MPPFLGINSTIHTSSSSFFQLIYSIKYIFITGEFGALFFLVVRDFFLQVLPLSSFRLNSLFFLELSFCEPPLLGCNFSILELSSGGAEYRSLPSTLTTGGKLN